MRIGFIGTGEIAAAMVRGLTGQGHQILVSERGAKMAAELAQLPDVSVAPNAEVVAQSDTVILCLMADTARAVLGDLPFRAEQSVISVMVDVPHDALQTLCAPATDISITIPLPFIQTGGCPLPVYPNAGAVASVFGAENMVFEVASEAALNAHFAATAMSSVVLAELQTAADWLTQFTGDAPKAEIYLSALISGYFKDMKLDGSGELKTALQALSTEGGLNATLRDHMSDARKELTQGLDAFRPRLGLPE